MPLSQPPPFPLLHRSSGLKLGRGVLGGTGEITLRELGKGILGGLAGVSRARREPCRGSGGGCTEIPRCLSFVWAPEAGVAAEPQ